jgi:hypothetical protein
MILSSIEQHGISIDVKYNIIGINKDFVKHFARGWTLNYRIHGISEMKEP